uniref:MSC domain-containing protein n=1 Tax=Syphacia muris TaxID=451379 RepID=A0A0N5AE55_9BILA
MKLLELWVGSEVDAQNLEGSVVQLKLTCSKYGESAYCLAFRIAGIQVNNRSLYRLAEREWSQIELIVCFLLAILLIITIFASVILWSICWRMKKGKLIAQIQTQFLFHLKQQQIYMEEQITAIRASYARQIERTIEDQFQSEYPIKRRLYFNAEFLEPEIMANPPLVAQQFIVELRRMIGMAKEKIRLKRHTPTLDSIQEEECEDEYQLHFTLPEKTTKEKTEGSSPKSIKSSDSGVSSLSDEETKSEQKSADTSFALKDSPASTTSHQDIVSEKVLCTNKQSLHRTPILTTTVINNQSNDNNKDVTKSSTFVWKSVNNCSDSEKKKSNNDTDSNIKSYGNRTSNSGNGNKSCTSVKAVSNNINDSIDTTAVISTTATSKNSSTSNNGCTKQKSYVHHNSNGYNDKSKAVDNRDLKNKSCGIKRNGIVSDITVDKESSSDTTHCNLSTRVATLSASVQPSRLPVLGYNRTNSGARLTTSSKIASEKLRKSLTESGSLTTSIAEITTANFSGSPIEDTTVITRIPKISKAQSVAAEPALSVVPPPLPVTPPPQLPMVQDKLKGTKRSTYAVFPSESMLKKSLPRRIRRPVQLQQLLNASKGLETTT